MAYQAVSSSSARRPYMGDNDGAYRTATAAESTNTYAGTTTRSTYAVGAAYETYSNNTDYYNNNAVVSSSYSPSPSPSASPSYPTDTDNDSEYNDLSAYLASIETVNGTTVATGTAADQVASSTATESSGNNISPIKIAAIGVPAAVGLIIVIVGVWLCCRCSRKRKQKEGGNRGQRDGGDMRQVGRGQDSWRFSVQALPHIRDQVYGGEDVVSRDMITRREVMGVVSGSPSYRSRNTGSYSPSPSYQTNLIANPVSGRYSRAPSSRDSRWADDSEMDAMAEDGSTITRTLSTTSTRRSMMTPDGPSSGENPFDHPAYTYRAARPRPAGTFARGPISAITTSGSSTTHQISSMQSTLSPITPITPAALHPSSAHLQSRAADTFSTHSSEDGTFGTPISRPGGLRREPTIIRHADSVGGDGSGYATKVEREGRDGVVELPPLYEDATASWLRQ